MRFKTLLFSFGFIAGSFSFAQTAQEQPAKPNTYKFKLYNAESNIKQATEFLTRITAASEVNYNPADSTFTLLTMRELDQKIVSGKLQKNFYPLKSMDKVDRSFPKMANTGNPEQDALDYDARKAKWIKENPEEYKRLSNSSGN